MRLRRGVSSSTAAGSVIAVAGVALALMVMELSLAIVTGFKDEIRAKVMGFEPELAVLPPYDVQTGLSDDEFTAPPELRRDIEQTMPGAEVVASVRRHAVLKTDSDYMAVLCIGREPGYSAEFERRNIVAGRWPDFAAAQSDSVVVSADMASAMRAEVGDRLFLYFFVDGEVKARRVHVAGIYCSHFHEFDRSVVYVPLSLAQGVGPDPKAVSRLEISGVPADQIADAATELQARLLTSYRSGSLDAVYPVDNVLRTGAIYFNWLDLLDTNVVVIFILMVCVAAFTLISSLFIIILDRVPTIGLLRSLGAPRSMVNDIFVAVSVRLTLAGMIIGNVAGLGLALLQRYTHLLPLDPEMYYLPYVPFEINWWAMLALNAGVAVAAWLIVILPARLASRIDPASTMRYE